MIIRHFLRAETSRFRGEGMDATERGDGGGGRMHGAEFGSALRLLWHTLTYTNVQIGQYLTKRS